MCVTGAIIGGSVLSGLGAKSAAKSGARAADNATAVQREIYNDIRNDLSPFRQAGGDALDAYLFNLGLGSKPAGYGGLESSPSALFAMEQGRDMMEAGAAGRGNLFSGSTAKGLEELRFGLASQDRDTQLNRLFNLTGMGQNAAAAQGNAGMNFANAAGQNALSAGNAAMAGKIGMANAVNDGIGQYIGYQNFNKLAGMYGGAA